MRRSSERSPQRERQFSEPKEGSFWSVYEYSLPGEEEIQEGYVAKELKQHFLFPEYNSETRTREQIKKVADHMRRERDHLHRFYDEELPDLIPNERILAIKSKEDLAGKIISVQEKIGEHVPVHELDPDTLNDSKEHEELREQLSKFIEISKAMVTAKDSEDPEFSHALPDITHLSNLAIEAINDRLVLRMYDTNYVLPVDSSRAQEQKHLERCAYRLIYIEHQLLGRSLEELSQENFYQNSEILDYIKNYHPDVPNISSRKLYDELNHPGSIAPWYKKQNQATPEETVAN